MLDRRLRLGRFFGIDLFVHWTFGLLVAYMVATSWTQGAAAVAYSVIRLLGVFLCVTLHEYGHALAARMFSVPTVDITLLPIGGVARLKRMPSLPWQELVVAVAGPAVNVVIVLLIVGGIAVRMGYGLISQMPVDRQLLIDLNDLLNEPSWWGFTITLLLVNVMLVVFNMIPAFPMDGGRVLRSLLAMMTSYRRATFVASRIGLVCAALMAMWGIQSGELMPVLIAAFIAFAGLSEARQVEVVESVRGVSMRNALIRFPPTVPMNTTLLEVASRWQSIPFSSLPVTSSTGSFVGMLHLKNVAAAFAGGIDPRTPAGELADHGVDPVLMDDDLEQILLRGPGGPGGGRVLPVVDAAGAPIGLLDLDSMLDRGKLPGDGRPAGDWHFDRLT